MTVYTLYSLSAQRTTQSTTARHFIDVVQTASSLPFAFNTAKHSDLRSHIPLRFERTSSEADLLHKAVTVLSLYSWYHILSRSTVQTETIQRWNTHWIKYRSTLCDDHCTGNATKCFTLLLLEVAKTAKIMLKKESKVDTPQSVRHLLEFAGSHYVQLHAQTASWSH